MKTFEEIYKENESLLENTFKGNKDELLKFTKKVLKTLFYNKESLINDIENIDDFTISYKDNKLYQFTAFTKNVEYNSIKIEIDCFYLSVGKQEGHTKYEEKLKIPIDLLNLNLR